LRALGEITTCRSTYDSPDDAWIFWHFAALLCSYDFEA
jgi:hypothetical protein